MPAGPVRRITIRNVVKDGDAIKALANQYGKLNKNVKRTSDSMATFTRAFRTAIAGFGIRELVRAVDQMQLLRDRISVFTGSAESAVDVFNDLALAARFTKTSINGLAQSYNRIALATKELGLSSDQILATTVALQQTFRLSGSTIAEATAATIQLTQGLSSGQLRGQELRSVLESNAVFAGLLAKELGTTRGNLIKFAESGKITSDRVLNVLRDNFESLNEQAGKLGTTITQSLTIAIDVFRLKLDEFNRDFGLASGFEQTLVFLIDNFDNIALAVGAIVIANNLPQLAEQFNLLTRSILKLSEGGRLLSTSGTLAVLTGFALAINKIKQGIEGDLGVGNVEKEIERTTSGILAARKRLDSIPDTERSALERLLGSTKESDIAREQKTIEDLSKRLKELQALRARGVTTVQKDSISDFIDRIKNSFNQLNAVIPTTNQGPFATLNKQLEKGIITLKEYDQAVASIKLDELNKKFRDGKIDIDQYNSGLIQLASNLNNVDSFSAGAEDGLRKVSRTASNAAQQISTGFVSAFKTLEDTIFDFIKKGEFSFAKFAQAIIDDITRIVIRTQIITAVAQGVSTLLSASAGGAGASSGGGGGLGQLVSGGAFAKGGVFNNGNVTAFANGGIINGPTLFPMRNGAGLMGEAGPEAVMPLARDGQGRLGVRGGGSSVQVNVINNTGGEVETQERQGPSGERILDVTINQKVKEGIASGAFDKSFSEAFGMQRRGR